MDETISRIKEFNSVNKNMSQVIMFDQTIKDIDIIKMYNFFGLDKEKLEKSMNNYRDVGIVLDLLKMDEDYKADWSYYIDKFILPKDEGSKFDNIMVSKDKNKLLLLTNRRLFRVDVQKMNEKIQRINRDITIYNEPVPKKKAEKKGFMDVIKGMFHP